VAVPVCHQHPRLPRIHASDPDRVAPADHGVNGVVDRPLVQIRRRVDDDCPPGALGVQHAHQPVDLGVEHPVLHSTALRMGLGQPGGGEDRLQVAHLVAPPRQSDADLPAHPAAATVGAHQVRPTDTTLLAIGTDNDGRHARLVLLDTDQRPAPPGRDRRAVGDSVAQRLLQPVLRAPLSGLGEVVALDVRQGEHAVEALDGVPGEARAEHRGVGPAEREARVVPDRLGNAEPAVSLHRLRIDLFAARRGEVGVQAGFDENAVDVPRPELVREGQADGPRPSDYHLGLDAPVRRCHRASPEARAASTGPEAIGRRAAGTRLMAMAPRTAGRTNP